MPQPVTEQESPPELLKRQSELERILNKFITVWNGNEQAVKLVLIENAAQKIAAKYFELLEGVIKIYMPPDSYANKFKVASGTEISIMHVLPIIIDDPNYNHIERRIVNAQFAIGAALTMLYSINYDNIQQLDTKKSTDTRLAQIINNHLLWLSRLNTRDINTAPTFINSNFWEAYMFASTGGL